jgi:hypothetical protein
LQVGGQLTVLQDSKPHNLPLSVAGQFQYDERLLADSPRRFVRRFREAQATINIDGAPVTPSLPDDRRLLVVEQSGAELLRFSPAGPLSREQLDLVSLPGDSLLLDQFLPAEPKRKGDTWTAEGPWAALLGLDAVATAEVEMSLSDARPGEIGVVEFSGRVDQRVAAYGLAVKEKRPMGHTGPGLDVMAKLELSLEPADNADDLAENALAGMPLSAADADLRLEFEQADGQYRLLLDRRWNVVGEEPELAVLRLVERGELVAQGNVAPMPGGQPGQVTTLPKFQAEVQKALGRHFGQFTSASERTHPAGYVHYRLVAVGQVGELPIEWRYHLLADTTGRQFVLACTLEPDLAELFADADETLVAGFEFLPHSAGETAAAEPATAERPATTLRIKE